MTDSTASAPSAVSATPNQPEAAVRRRLVSLDQFRGYTVAGMFLVNFFGGYTICPQILRHTHDYCSYADTIMPQFLFAVGFALRLSFLKQVEQHGLAAAWNRMTRRMVGLIAVALFWYSFTNSSGIESHMAEEGWGGTLYWLCKRAWFQTLLHIAVTSIWILPVLSASLGLRVLYGCASGLLHVLLSWWFNFEWCNTGANCIDGGPLGFLTWSIPALAGTWACDVARSCSVNSGCVRLVLFGVLMMAAAWGLSCGTTIYDVPEQRVAELKDQKLAENPVIPSRQQLAEWSRRAAEPPFVRPPDQQHRKWNYWMMSQRAGTLTYLMFSAGFSALVYAFFLKIGDGWGLQFGVFRTFGVNALSGYIVHDLTGSIVGAFFNSKTSAAAVQLLALVCFFVLTWLILRAMEKRQMFLRV
jgi:predicted acyltransferase